MFSQEDIIELFQDQWLNVNQKDIEYIHNNEGGISAFECVLMYLWILKTKPDHIIEFSPNRGYSTFAIASAQRILGKKKAFATFDIEQRFCNLTKARIDTNDLSEYCSIVCGDAIAEVMRYVSSKDARVGLCFIDSDHGAVFAQQYINRLFPIFKKDCTIIIHDIAANKLSSNGRVPFKTSLLGGVHPGGEEGPVLEYLQTHKKRYTVLHSITGGQHEGAQLPINDILYNTIKQITSFDFRKSISPPCPKSLIFSI